MSEPFCLWLTGLSGAGKSSLAAEIQSRYPDVRLLDGDVMRKGASADLGFSPEDRAENIRRAALQAREYLESGESVVAAFITPYEHMRASLREQLSPFKYYEVYVDCSLEVCMARDPKGLYARALAGELPDFTGVSAPFEVPQTPDVKLQTASSSIVDCVDELVARIFSESE